MYIVCLNNNFLNGTIKYLFIHGEPISVDFLDQPFYRFNNLTKYNAFLQFTGTTLIINPIS